MFLFRALKDWKTVENVEIVVQLQGLRWIPDVKRMI